MLDLREAGLISTTMEAMLYGFSVLMFGLTVWILFHDKSQTRINYGLLLPACALMALATGEMIVNIVRICQGFLNIGPTLPGGPEAYFETISELTFLIKSVFYNTQTLILDAVVIYRAYSVWQNVWVVVVPIFGWFGLLASSFGLNYSLATAAKDSSDIFTVQTGRWITATYSLTLATNLLSTALLAFRIWQISRQTAGMRAHNMLTPVLRAVIESGAIYSAIITAALITFVLQSTGVYVVLDMISPIISIVFNMIIITARLSVDQRQNLSSTVPTYPSLDKSRRQSGFIQSKLQKPYELNSIAVQVTKYQETDADVDSVTAAGLKSRPEQAV